MTADNISGSPQMGQCAMTGKVVPEDELITLHGYRVSAEGKAILLERLKSGEVLPGEREKPTVTRRFRCLFLDGLIVNVPAAILTLVVTGAITGMRSGSPMLAGAVALVVTTLQIVYFGQMHGTCGQTVGKMAGKLIVVNLDGSPITLGTGYIRALAYLGPSFAIGIAEFSGSEEIALYAQFAVGAYGLINVLFALMDGNMQRALHDRIAGTRVIMKD